jgi:hypothetical protein
MIICVFSLFLLITTSLATLESNERKVYKAYWGRITVFGIIISAIIFAFVVNDLKIFQNEQLEINEDYIILLILFFSSLILKKIKRKQ